jgi:cobalamin biosynthesis protein CobD/CbiB
MAGYFITLFAMISHDPIIIYIDQGRQNQQAHLENILTYIPSRIYLLLFNLCFSCTPE